MLQLNFIHRNEFLIEYMYIVQNFESIFSEKAVINEEWFGWLIFFKYFLPSN